MDLKCAASSFVAPCDSSCSELVQQCALNSRHLAQGHTSMQGAATRHERCIIAKAEAETTRQAPSSTYDKRVYGKMSKEQL